MTQYLYKLSEMRSFGCSDARVTEQGWLIAQSTVNRDSDSISISNHRTIEKALTKIDPDQETWGVMHCGHWAVGWVDHFVVAPDSPAAAEVIESLGFIAEVYPILSDDDHSALECERHDEGICDDLHCSLCDYDRENHRGGTCHSDCKLCREEAEENGDDPDNVACGACGDTFPIADMPKIGRSANGQIEYDNCPKCRKEDFS
jgi:hypothetical protein